MLFGSSIPTVLLPGIVAILADSELVFLAISSDRLIILEGWSKTFCMTGWRLGWSMWPKKLYDYANKLCVNDHSCPSIISQYAGLEALKGPKEEIEKIKK